MWDKTNTYSLVTNIIKLIYIVYNLALLSVFGGTTRKVFKFTTALELYDVS